MKSEPGEDELVAIVAAYVILMRKRRRLAAVPAPDSRWHRTARLEAVEPAGILPVDRDRRMRRRAPFAP